MRCAALECFCCLFDFCLFATRRESRQFPDHPLHLIVPQAAGSATDTLARLLAAPPSVTNLGNRSLSMTARGGALTVGLDRTAKSAPDGYTLCMGPIGALAITPASGGSTCPTTSRAIFSRSRW